ncbi:Alpha/Beta hydrolase protein [Plectosphaerella cucumerina]|uniref:Alpha/Beta hydrolase protein n=1 Tax=Plectosphaerella cucumerina TaxID=40658 RepID=A0A8K0T541_9PEZI|nr:Alpha/Beta hydrolase protein [Plectosphaerella cucumerina]
MLNFFLTYKWLYWTAPSSEAPPPPPGLERHYINTPSGRIEVLSNQPSNPSNNKTPIFFIHGGMGSAWVWTEYMQYLARHDVPCYAVSLRGHGNSWHPSYLRMVYLTTRQNLADDALAAMRWVRERQGSDVLLVGHSSGGGLSQGILSAGQARVKGLALLGAVPGFGSAGVYMNWATFDPWFSIRMLFHGWHPNSPLSHPFLVRQAFFSSTYPEDKLTEFATHANRYESFLWPISMMVPFTRPESILSSIEGWGADGERLMVMTGTGDKMMTRDIMEGMAETYRGAFDGLVDAKKLDAKSSPVAPLEGEGGRDNAGRGVRQTWVPVAGHHLQNDVTWEVGAKKLLDFYEQL